MRDADDFIRSLPQPIAVVGNGMIRDRREEIESHATVVRFNNFADVGFESDVGHTVNVWCISCCGFIVPRTWAHRVDVMTIATVKEQPEDIPRWAALYPDMAVPTESWIFDARQFKGANPTTGLTLMLRLMKHGVRFTAFGFDGLRSGHYWDIQHKHTPSHQDELPALMELAQRGVNFR